MSVPARERSGWNLPLLLLLSLVLTASGTRPLQAAERTQPDFGEPVHGLVVAASLSGAQFREGETLRLEATLKNLSDWPLVLDMFGELDALYAGKRPSIIIPSCWALSWEPALTLPTPRRGKMPLEPQQFIRVPPGGSYTVTLERELMGLPPGSYQVRLAYAPRAAGPSFHFPIDWTKQLPPDRLWADGMIFSNELTLDVIAAP